MSTLILLDLTPPIATITLNRPQRHNSLIPEMLTALLDAFNTIAQSPEIRVVILKANGRSFSTGGDVKAFYLQRNNLEAYAHEIVGLLNEVILTMVRLHVPIVTAVHGIVTGGSIGLLLASDWVIVSRPAKITPFYSIVGFSPDGGWTAMLPNIIGAKRTSAILMHNQTITAAQAIEWGIAHSISAAGNIQDETMKIVQDLLQKNPGSLTHTKQLFANLAPDLPTRLEAERTHFIQQILTPAARHGMETFLKIKSTTIGRD
ncbi:MAG: enoyl-CoA hydratase/isomerase family protein [Chloroflexi bacterium]|nr:enoyl-CoA hydratase/isomerase family protein [Chloroflexota bacterium]